MPMTRGIGFKCFSLTGTMLAAALLPHLACAALGEPESTAKDDAQRLEASIKSTDHANYRVHEIQLPSGTRGNARRCRRPAEALGPELDARRAGGGRTGAFSDAA